MILGAWVNFWRSSFPHQGYHFLQGAEVISYLNFQYKVPSRHMTFFWSKKQGGVLYTGIWGMGAFFFSATRFSLVFFFVFQKKKKMLSNQPHSTTLFFGCIFLHSWAGKFRQNKSAHVYLLIFPPCGILIVRPRKKFCYLKSYLNCPLP